MRLNILALLGLLALVAAWSKEDHEIFRLKDELEKHEGTGITFYDFLSIPPTASQDEINKAYRKKSKLLHPDKAKRAFIASRETSASKSARSASQSSSSASASKSKKAPKPTAHAVKPPSQKEIQKATKAASERFTRLGLIANILRGSGRARYDHFLANGFPAWRGADYYYSRFRPGLGSVLLGLFLFAGGAVHYGVLVLGHKRQKDFVERYIRQARTLAWGDAGPTAGIPGIDTAGSTASVSSPLAEEQEPGNVQAMNRRERRIQEKQAKKPSAASRRAAKGQQSSGTSTPREEGSGAETPIAGPKKRVQAENGKILVVDSAGNVFLEEEDEEGKTGLFLLDPNEVEKPSFKQTIVIKFPLWAVAKVKKTFFGADEVAEEGRGRTKAAGGKTEAGEEIDGFVNVTDEEAEATKWVEDKKSGSAGAARKRKGKIR